MKLLLTTLSILATVSTAIGQPCNQQVIANYTAPACDTRSFTLSASIINGASYSWTGPSFTSNAQNPTLTGISFTTAGDYIVTVIEGSCTYKDTVTVVVEPTPLLPILSLGPMCEGMPLHVTAMSNTGSQFNFYDPNGNLINNNWITSLNSSHDGEYKVVAYNMAGCVSDTALFDVQVTPYTVPVVSVTGSGASGPFGNLTFTANISNAGGNPAITWLKNGTLIPSANSDVYTAVNGIDVMAGDQISVRVIADAAPCGDTTISNAIAITTELGINTPQSIRGLSVCPNPSNGAFKIHMANAAGAPVHIAVLNTLGQVVYEKTYAADGVVEVNAQLPAGNYLLKADAGKGVSVVRMTVE